MNEEMSELRKELGIDDWLELVKEDKNLNGSYISFAQYMYLLEKEVNRAKRELYDICTQFNEKMKKDNRLKEQQKEILDLKIKNLELEKRLLELEVNNDSKRDV